MTEKKFVPKFFKLKSHFLKKRDTCGAMTGICLPSVKGTANYTYKYNKFISDLFLISIKELGSMLDNNEYAEKFTKHFPYEDEIKYDYDNFNIKINKMTPEDKLLDPESYLQDQNEDFDYIINLINKNNTRIQDYIEIININYKFDKMEDTILKYETLFRQEKIDYFRIKKNIHFLIWKWGIWNMPAEWKSWLMLEWRHSEYIMENTFHYYLMKKLETNIEDKDNEYKLMMDENYNTIKKLLEEHKITQNKLSGIDLLYSNEILKLMNEQVESLNNVKNKWDDFYKIKKKNKDIPSNLFQYSLAGLGLLISCIIFNK